MNRISKKWISPAIGLIFATIMIGGFFLPSLPAGEAEPPQPSVLLSPEPGHSKTCVEIVQKLQKQHYQKLPLDDRLSEKIFDRFLTDLDPSRIYFLASDIREFEEFRLRLDDTLKNGDLANPFFVFNRFQQRTIERLNYTLKLIQKGIRHLDLDKEEVLETERERAPWPLDAGEVNALWRKRLKNDVIGLKLAGKPDAEIADVLEKRYRNRLNLARRTKNEDAFRIYMNSLTQTFDPHTQYLAPRASEDFNIRMSLSLEGIGAVLQSENEFTKVVSLVPAGPADKTKQIRPGDRIVAVAQGMEGELVDVIGWRIDDVVQLIRGPKLTVVRLKVIPADAADTQQSKILQITRNTVELEEQAAQKKLLEVNGEAGKYKIGIIDIPAFYSDFRAIQAGDANFRSTTRDVRRLLKELIDEKVDGILIDLRDNGGGSLQEVSSLVGLFIRTGPTVQVREAGGRISELRDQDTEVVYDGPLAVLVNRLSASASEIFAGAIQDYGRGIILGSQTFGKGTVQSLLNLKEGQLKVTVAKYYRISGESTQHRGVIPDIRFPAIHDSEKIGESALPEALPWDKIRSAKYIFNPNLYPLIDRLQDRHLSRIQADPDFIHLEESLKIQRETRRKTDISLRAERRKKEREISEKARLSIENRRRAAKGLKPLEKVEEPSETDATAEMRAPGSEESAKKVENDPLLVESGNILRDLIALLKQNG